MAVWTLCGPFCYTSLDAERHGSHSTQSVERAEKSAFIRPIRSIRGLSLRSYA
jgi:hypothetical protein